MTSRTQPTAQAQADPISETLRLVNQVRAANGLPPYQYNATLATAAQIHANWMAATNTYSHTETNGSTPYSRAVGVGYPSTGYVSENIVGGTKLSPRQAVIWWENSPVHFAGMVSSNNVEAGVGFASSGDQNYYVLVMGRPPAPGQETALAPRAQEPQAQPLFITPVQLAPPRDDGSIVHIVQPGQALWTLAAYYDVDLAYLELINGLPDDPLLRTGQEILIRLAEGQAPPPTPTPRLQHIVRAGETAWTIAALHGLTLGQLYALNGLTTDPVLHPGDLLWIREPLPTATPPYPPTFTPAPTRTPAAELTPPMPAFSPTPIPTITSAATATPLVLNTASSLPATPANNNLLLVAVGLLILGGFVMLVLRRA
ncbi:MAG: LysM peptidoglycan-binding domain-containing protein [Anaerolineales bacterium]|nr:LysM peptidoglycan-binding domain-containing protein [Anaerolineales bacterium]